MGLLEQQNILARLYTDGPFRESFFADPSRVGREGRLSVREISETHEIRDEVAIFADALLWKRLREVEKLLPLTKAAAENDFQPKFRKFASTYNPKSTRTHLDDAVAFCGTFRKDPTAGDVLRDAAAYEAAKMRFFAFERRLTYCFIKYDFRAFPWHPENLPVRTRRRIAIWLRWRGRPRHFIL